MRIDLEYYKQARRRARRRKSPWNILIAILAIFLWMILGWMSLNIVDLVHRQFYPDQSLFPGRSGFAVLIAILPAWFALIPLVFVIANFLISLAPSAHLTLELEAKRHRGGSYRESQYLLIRVCIWSIPIGLVLSAIGILMPWG